MKEHIQIFEIFRSEYVLNIINLLSNELLQDRRMITPLSQHYLTSLLRTDDLSILDELP